MTQNTSSELRRERMVEEQLARFGVTEPRVLEAFRSVPRELFVPRRRRRLAYWSMPVSIGHGQTISQPRIVAHMLQLAGIGAGQRVLDVGSGSGYQSAVLARLGAEVYGVELIPALVARANDSLRQAGIENVRLFAGDGHAGLPQFAPFDAILVAAATPSVPQALLDQLKDGGRLIVPVGPRLSRRQMSLRMAFRRRSPQQLVRIVRHGDRLEREDLGRVWFVPFVDPRELS